MHKGAQMSKTPEPAPKEEEEEEGFGFNDDGDVNLGGLRRRLQAVDACGGAIVRTPESEAKREKEVRDIKKDMAVNSDDPEIRARAQSCEVEEDDDGLLLQQGGNNCKSLKSVMETINEPFSFDWREQLFDQF